MSLWLRCPSCGVGEGHIYADQEATLTYDVSAAGWTKLGVALALRHTEKHDGWLVGCDECGFQNTSFDEWLERVT